MLVSDEFLSKTACNERKWTEAGVLPVLNPLYLLSKIRGTKITD